MCNLIYPPFSLVTKSMRNLQSALCIKQVLIILMQDYSLLTPNWLLLAPVCLQLRLCNRCCHCRLALHRLKPSSLWFHPSLGALTLLARGAASHHQFFQPQLGLFPPQHYPTLHPHTGCKRTAGMEFCGFVLVRRGYGARKFVTSQNCRKHLHLEHPG